MEMMLSLSSALKKERRTLRQQFGFTRSGPGDHGAVVGRAHNVERIVLQRVDAGRLPILGLYVPPQQRHLSLV